MPVFHVWQNAWKDNCDVPLALSLPENFSVEECEMPGDRCPALTRDAMVQRINTPLGMDSIHTLAARGREAVIAFDDLSRGTQVNEIAHIVLDELLSGGMSKDHIRFICAIGAHAPLDRAGLARKLGEDIVEEYPVYNHNCFAHCTCIGTDRTGLPIEINEEFLGCDVRVGIGAVSPHVMNGYGGGGKLLFPGLASINTTVNNHSRRQYAHIGSKETCGLREDIEDMTRHVGSFFKIDALYNARLATIGLYAGDPIRTYHAAIQASAAVHALPRCAPKDVVFANANAKYNEAYNAIRVAKDVCKPGGDVVLINHCPAGQIVHYAYSPFGKSYGGPMWRPWEVRSQTEIGRMIYYTPYPDYFSKLMFNEPDKVVFAKTWDDVLRLLAQRHAGKASACVLSDASIGYFPQMP